MKFPMFLAKFYVLNREHEVVYLKEIIQKFPEESFATMENLKDFAKNCADRIDGISDVSFQEPIKKYGEIKDDI